MKDFFEIVFIAAVLFFLFYPVYGFMKVWDDYDKAQEERYQRDRERHRKEMERITGRPYVDPDE